MLPTQSLLAAILSETTVAATGVFDSTLCFLGLLSSATIQSPTSATTAANVGLATGSLAPGVTIGPLLGPYPLNDGSSVLEGADILRFTPSTSVDNQQVIGTWLGTAATLGTLLGIELFDKPVQLVAGGDPLSVIPRLSLTPSAMGTVSQVYDG
jgi:hypothetical protein